MAKTRTIKSIVFHTSDSPDDLDIGFKQINEWHKERGWESPSGVHCGYHYVIRRDGRIEKGRPESEVGAHVEGHNASSIGVVWVGRKHMTPEQRKAALQLISNLRAKYKVAADKVYGHCELNPAKTCPNIDMNLFRADLLFVKPEGV